MNCLSHCITGSRKSSKTKTMAHYFRRRALFTDVKQGKYTFVSLGGDLVKRQTRGGGEEMSLLLEYLAASGFLHRCGIRNGDRLLRVNFTAVNDIPFDILVEAIRGLMPLALTVERTSKEGTIVTIVVVIDIQVDKRDEPYLKFHGFYFWNDTESFRPGGAIPFIPIDVEPLTTYSYYPPPVKNITFVAQQDDKNYWLTVDGSDIVFRTEKSDKALFTMYKYNSTKVDTGTSVILVPQDISSQCLEATSSNELNLTSFDQEEYTKEGPLPENGRFLLLVEEAPNQYKIESTMNEGQYIDIGQDDEAVLSGNGVLLTMNEEPN